MCDEKHQELLSRSNETSKEFTDGEKACKEAKLYTLDYDLRMDIWHGLSQSDNILYHNIEGSDRLFNIELKCFKNKNKAPAYVRSHRYKGMNWMQANQEMLKETMCVIENGIGTREDVDNDRAKGYAYRGDFRDQCLRHQKRTKTVSKENWYFAIEHHYSAEPLHQVFEFNAIQGTFKPFYKTLSESEASVEVISEYVYSENGHS